MTKTALLARRRAVSTGNSVNYDKIAEPEMIQG